MPHPAAAAAAAVEPEVALPGVDDLVGLTDEEMREAFSQSQGCILL